MMKNVAGWRPMRGARRAGLAAALVFFAGCGAQELYEPPVAPFEVRGRLALPSQAQDVAVLGNYAFVACGEAGLLVVDISDPAHPTLVLVLDTVKYAESIRVASVSQVSGVTDIAFVVEGTEGITTYDITDPVHATSFGQRTTAVDGSGLFIELPSDPTQPYVVYLAESWKGLRIFESDPAAPGLLQYYGVYASTRGFAKAVTVKDGYAYVADDEMGLAVLDARTRAPQAVHLVSACDTQGMARGVDMVQDHVYIADDANGLVVMELRKEFVPAAGDSVPVPYEIGHLPLPGRCRAVVVRDGMAFIAAQEGGVHIVDVNNPSAPFSLGSVVSSYSTGIALSKAGLAVVSDRDEGLIVLEGGSPFSDPIPPARVTDLAATTVDSVSVRLAWHAPGDDGLAGQASQYDIRYAPSSIDTDTQWDAATQVEGEAAPAASGQSETLEVTGLTPATTYFFALRTADAQSNWSSRSNVASATTFSGPIPPALRDPRVTPEAGTPDTVFVFEVTYQDPNGDPPVEAKVYIGATSYDMAMVSGSYRDGALFRYQTTLPAGAYEHHFVFSDGILAPVSTPTRFGPWSGEVHLAGSPPDEPGRDTDETQHQVVLTGVAWVSDHEVTQSEYQSVMGTNPSQFSGADLPVENVTWFDAVAYCNARSLDEGFSPAYTIAGATVTWDKEADGYRLPTEAEWEVACRAGTATAFAGGGLTEESCGVDPVLDALGWYCGNAGATTHPVMSKASNDRGLYDMHGNVWEWCWDWYAADLGTGVAGDPEGPATGSQRVIRGGCWYYFARECRSASRAPYWPNSKDDVVGFRVVRTVP